MRIYARCMTGMEDVWIARMDQALRLEDNEPSDEDGESAS
jgi:hypothetical protein